MKAMDSSSLRIGAWRVDPALDQISKDGNTVKLERRAMQLLLCLAEHAGEVVSVERLLDQVWAGVVVTPDSVYHAVAALRRLLGDDTKEPAYIANIPRRGYRLIAPVAPSVDVPQVSAEDAPSPAAEPPRATLAVKEGPFTLRAIATLLSIALFLALGYVGIYKFRLSRSVATEPPAPQVVSQKSIAVLPFLDMSEKKDQEYFGDGMAEEILDLLVKIPGLKVIGRTSSFQFKGKNEDLRTIGNKLGAAYVLEGSVRESGNRLRVSAQLIDSRDGTQLMSQTYDRDMSDILKMQDEIAATLVRALQIEVSAADGIVPRPALSNTESYTLYLQGRHAVDRFDQKGFEQAANYFQRALELDPSFAAAAAELASTYSALGEWDFMPRAIASERARNLAERAISLKPDLAIAHAVLGNIHLVYDWDWPAADREIRQAMVLAPNDALILQMAARHLLITGRWDDALKLLNASLEQDPLSPGGYIQLNWVQIRRGRLAEAEAAVRRTLEISPTFSWAHYYLGVTLLARGQREAALAEFQKETADGGRLGGCAIAYFALGRKSESNAALAARLKLDANDDAFGIASTYAFRGESDEAMRWLDRAYAQKDPGLYTIKGEPPLKNLEADPRFKAFLRKMNLPD
jgi:TolB-like protein/DNA-binding winged helix-turn-helix (wHTH) protein/Tfp pilus assembly protein PilF